MYQLDYFPIKLANLNDYFTRYRETKDEKYFNEFLYYYEPVLNRNARLFIKKYSLDSNRIDDLKQIFIFCCGANCKAMIRIYLYYSS